MIPETMHTIVHSEGSKWDLMKILPPTLPNTGKFLDHSVPQFPVFLSFKFYLFLTMPGLCCFAQAFSSCKWRLLTSCGAQASHSGKFSCIGSRCSYWVTPWWWDLSEPRLYLTSPDLAGRLLTTGPPGKPSPLSTEDNDSTDFKVIWGNITWNMWITTQVLEIIKSKYTHKHLLHFVHNCNL